MGSTKEVKVKKEKSSKKTKSGEKVEVVTEVSVVETEDVAMDDAQEVETKKAKKEKKEKREKKEKKSKSEEAVAENGDIADKAAPAKPKSKKSKRKAEDVETEAKENSPEPESMDVDDSERPAKKRKAVVPEGEELEVDVTLPQPPSKKELRRLKKGKSLPKKKTTSELKAPKPDAESGAEDGDAKPAKEKPEQEKRSEHGIWVGNLPWSVSKEDLKSFLINQGPIADENITRIHMPSPDDKRPANMVESRFTRKQHNKGFAYVDFKTADDTVKAVALSEELLGGRRVLIKNSKSFEGRPLVVKGAEATKKPGGLPPNKRVFIGNLRFDTTEESLKEHFLPCGPIEECMVATFEDSGKCKGYAWVTFEELASAERAVRGFYLEEMHDTDDEDTEDEEEDAEKAEEDESDPEDYANAVKKEKKPAKKPQMRRRYVNMIDRRPIRIEFAEDKETRYKKRYGAGGTKNPAGEERAPREEKPKEEKVVSGVIVPSKKAQKMDYRNEYAPRLTGGIVESKGTKVTF